MAKREAGTVRHVRMVTEGLIDESGSRWDRVTSSDGVYMTPEEASPFIDGAIRFLTTSGYGSRVRDVDRREFATLVSQSPGHRVEAFRASDGTSRILVTIDTSDCHPL